MLRWFRELRALQRKWIMAHYKIKAENMTSQLLRSLEGKDFKA